MSRRFFLAAEVEMGAHESMRGLSHYLALKSTQARTALLLLDRILSDKKCALSRDARTDALDLLRRARHGEYRYRFDTIRPNNPPAE